MPLATATITGDLANQIGAGFDPKRSLGWVTTTAPNDTVIDTNAEQIRLGSGPITINPDGTISVQVWVPGVGSNPPTWQTTFHIAYTDRGETKEAEFGPYTITESKDLAKLIREQELPAPYVTQVTEMIDGKVAEAEAARDGAAASAAAAADLVLSDLGTTDGQTRALIENPASQVALALNTTIETVGSDVFTSRNRRGQASAWATSRRGAVPGTVSLLTGSDEEGPTAAFSRVGFNGGALDTVNTKINGRAWKFVAPGGTADPKVTFTIPEGPLRLANPAQAVDVKVHIPDVTGITGFNINLYQDVAKTIFLSRGTAGGDFFPQQLVNGDNFFRFPLGAVWKPAWTGESVAAIDLIVKGPSTIAPTMTLQHVYLECPDSSPLIQVQDRGYRSFILNGGLARMRAARIPLTWAIDVTAMGGNIGIGSEAITHAELRQMWAEGDSISFHGWDGAPTSSMTAAQVRTDAMKSLRHLAAEGYEGRMWRAAWVQNSGNAAAIKDLVLAQSFTSPSAPVTWPQASPLEAWPPHDLHSIYRWNVSGAGYAGQPGGSPAYVDAVFAAAKATRSALVPYFHGIQGGPGSIGAAVGVNPNDPTLAQFNYYMDHVEAGIDEGWLRPTTFEAEWYRMGGSFSTIGGGSTATWTDPDGTRRTKTLL